MNKTIQISALEARLDYLIKKFDAQPDDYVQSHLARYLIILTAGYFEQAIQSSLAHYARERSHGSVANYVDTTLAWEGSINRAKLERILSRFDQGWFANIDRSANDAERNAVDSIKELRDQLAHGLDNGTSYAVAKRYHALVRDYVMRLLATLP